MKTKLLLAITAFTVSPILLADSVGAKLSTLGVGVEYTLPVDNQWDVGFSANLFNYNKSYTNDGITYKGKVKLRTLGAVGYFYPWENNGFNINGGLFYNANKATLDVKPTTDISYTFNDVAYSTKDLKRPYGEVKFNKVAPYVGIGWKSGSRKDTGLAFDANLGIMLHGTPKVSLSAECSGSLALNTDISKQACKELKKNVTAEERSVQSDVKKFKVFPVVSIGAVYRF